MQRKRKRILLLIPELGYGGAEKALLQVAGYLARHHEVKVAVFRKQYARGNYARTKQDHPFQVVEMDEEEHHHRLKRWMRRWQRLRALKADVDVTISFLTGTNILNVLSGGSRNVVSIRGSRKYDPNIGYIGRLLYLWLIDPLVCLLADDVVLISRGVGCETGGILKPWIERRTRVIPPMIDAARLADMVDNKMEDKSGDSCNSPVIVSAGRMSPEKGFVHLIRVFAGVRETVPDARLVLIGDGPQLESLVSVCDAYGLGVARSARMEGDAAVLFTGFVDDPVREFSRARVFVLSSLTEGFSNVLMEALASGIPIVANDAPWGARTLLCEHPHDVCRPYATRRPTRVDYGILMPRIDKSEHEDAWVAELVAALRNENRDEVQARRNRQRVWQFDKQIIGRQWLCLVDESD